MTDTLKVDPRHVQIPAGTVGLIGDLTIPERPIGLVAFAHGSGSSRLSPRNRAVATSLNRAGLATLLFDLLTEEESANRANVFDIPLLADRLLAATGWVERDPELVDLRVGYFGASTGAGAALIAAARAGERVSAVVSRGGRPDLAGDWLAGVQAPTLLVIGSRDTMVLELNRSALAQLHCPKQLVVVPGATHLFEEPGTLAEVCRVAGDWFRRHLGAPG